ncbi:MAG: PGF-pre-PGF domain-containing protein, partial [Candidatus Micrarchaeia archaeon]
PDCSCILPPNATPLEVPEEITVIATRGGALVAIPSIAAERISSVTFSAAITNFTSILSIALTSRRNLADVKIEITKLDAKPLSLEEPPYKVYKYLEITAENASESDWLEAVITFKVEKLWIGTRYNASSVKLLRYSSDTWKPLETNLMSQTTTDYIFEAVTPGFSYFAITATELSTPEPILPLPSNITIDETKQSTISLTTVIVMIATITLIFIAIVIIYSKMKSARKWRPKSPM